MLGTLNYLVLVLFFLFLGTYLGKLIIMSNRDKIKANVLAKGNKDKEIRVIEILVKISTFIWGHYCCCFRLVN